MIDMDILGLLIIILGVIIILRIFFDKDYDAEDLIAEPLYLIWVGVDKIKDRYKQKKRDYESGYKDG
jgi:hypothetical protein